MHRKHAFEPARTNECSRDAKALATNSEQARVLLAEHDPARAGSLFQCLLNRLPRDRADSDTSHFAPGCGS
jgi:hypothetical protein